MAKPFVRPFARPRSPEAYPVGPCFTAGHLVETNATWRSERPVVTAGSCSGCLRCVLACPDGAVLYARAAVRIDYDFCKGCGLCVRECPAGAIRMIPEKVTEKKHGS
jgi:pyruvate ferredoxin oxidoreductase delta subunit